ncbi:MAG: type II toxin-antitoxin system Phd/YefM family antitoxin, partial [bacterium]
MRSTGVPLPKNRLSGFVRLAGAGEIIRVTDRDRVVAELGPPQRGRTETAREYGNNDPAWFWGITGNNDPGITIQRGFAATGSFATSRSSAPGHARARHEKTTLDRYSRWIVIPGCLLLARLGCLALDPTILARARCAACGFGRVPPRPGPGRRARDLWHAHGRRSPRAPHPSRRDPRRKPRPVGDAGTSPPCGARDRPWKRHLKPLSSGLAPGTGQARPGDGSKEPMIRPKMLAASAM